VRAPATRTVTQRLTAVPATPPPTAPDADGIDRDRIDEILADGGLGFLGSLVDTFRGDAPRLLGAIAAALDAGELTAVIRPTHELKGAAAGLGLAALAQACLALEHAATTGMADTDRLHRELTSRYMAALEGLDRIIAR
jgi:HPt (histidine-containing phosphotransfer) domain-containing protein